jgi:hypothetical protein
VNEEYKLKAKQFLERYLVEYAIKINNLKRKRRIVKKLFANLIFISLTSSMICAILSSLIFVLLPLFLLPTLNMLRGLETALSEKFNLDGMKDDLNRAIDEFDKIQLQIDFVVSCKGNFTEAEYKLIMLELSHFAPIK